MDVPRRSRKTYTANTFSLHSRHACPSLRSSSLSSRSSDACVLLHGRRGLPRCSSCVCSRACWSACSSLCMASTTSLWVLRGSCTVHSILGAGFGWFSVAPARPPPPGWGPRGRQQHQRRFLLVVKQGIRHENLIPRYGDGILLLQFYYTCI